MASAAVAGCAPVDDNGEPLDQAEQALAGDAGADGGEGGIDLGSQTFRLAGDVTPPTGSFTITGTNPEAATGYSDTQSVTLTISATDDLSSVTEMCVKNTAAACASSDWKAFQASYAHLIDTSSQGAKTVYLYLGDSEGNRTSTAITANVWYDSTNPGAGTVSATAGAGAVDLTVSGMTDSGSGLKKVKFVARLNNSANDWPAAGCVLTPGKTELSAEVSASAFPNGAGSVTWVGFQNDNKYYIRACAVDNAGNIPNGSFTASFVMPKADPTAPVGQGLAGQPSAPVGVSFTQGPAVLATQTVNYSDSDPEYAGVYQGIDVQLRANDSVGVTEYCLKWGSSTCATADWIPVTATTSLAVSVTAPNVPGGAPPPDGVKTLYAKFRDAALNESPVYSAAITLDTRSPVNGYLTATAGNGSVALSVTDFRDTGSGIDRIVFAHDTAGTPADCSTPVTGLEIVGNGAATVSGTVTHSGLQNATAAQPLVHYYRACAVDRYGRTTQTGSFSVASASPRSDLEPPTGSFGVDANGNGTLDGVDEPAFVSSNTVALVMQGADTGGGVATPASMCISNYSNRTTNCADGTGNWVSYEPTATHPVTAGDGKKTVHVWFRDAAGNIYKPPFQRTVVDTAGPIDRTIRVVAGLRVNDLWWSPAYDKSGIDHYTLVGSTVPEEVATCAVGAPLYYESDTVHSSSSMYRHTPATADVGKIWYYRVCATDIYGQMSPGVAISAYVRPELDAPLISSVLIQGNDQFDDFTNTNDVGVTITAADASPIDSVCFSTTGTLSSCNNRWITNWNGIDDVDYELSGAEGENKVWVRVRDMYGNVSDSKTDTIILDLSAPSVTTFTATAGAEGDARFATLSWVQPTEASPHTGEWGAVNEEGRQKIKWTTGSTTVPACSLSGATDILVGNGAISFSDTGLAKGTKYNYRICVRDRAGNWSLGLVRSATMAR